MGLTKSRQLNFADKSQIEARILLTDDIGINDTIETQYWDDGLLKWRSRKCGGETLECEWWPNGIMKSARQYGPKCANWTFKWHEDGFPKYRHMKNI